MVRKRFLLYIIALFSLTLNSCLEELKEVNSIDKFNYNPEIGLPLVDSRLFFSSFSDELTDFSISTDQEGTIVLSYSKDIYDGIAENYFSLPNQTSPIVNITGIDSGGIPLVGTLSADASDTLTVEPNENERLDLVRLKAGMIRLVVNSSYTVDGEVLFSIPNLLVGGTSFSERFSISPGNNTVDIDLVNSTINLVGDGSLYNKLPFGVQLDLSGNGSIVTNGQSLEAYFQILDPAFELIIGESPYRLLEDRNGIEAVNIFTETQIGTFRLAEPKIQLNFENSFGLPFEVDVASISIKGKSGSSSALTGDVIDNNFVVAAPAVVGASASSSFIVDTSNSNISDMLSEIPSEFSFTASAFYPGGDSKIFVLDQSSINITGMVEIPLYGSILDLSVTKDFDLDASVFDNFLEASLSIDAQNRFPIETGITIRFKDSQGNILLELLNDDPVITAAAPVDAQGKSTGEEEKHQVISLDSDQLESLKSATSISLQIGMSTSEDGAVLVRILDSDYLNLHVSIKGKLKI